MISSCYLRGRDDTVHCIVTSLTEEGAADLSEELTGCKKIALCDMAAPAEDDMENWETWLPDPIEVVPGTFDRISDTKKTRSLSLIFHS